MGEEERTSGASRKLSDEAALRRRIPLLGGEMPLLPSRNLGKLVVSLPFKSVT
jgi:hypothetical protein